MIKTPQRLLRVFLSLLKNRAVKKIFYVLDENMFFMEHKRAIFLEMQYQGLRVAGSANSRDKR